MYEICLSFRPYTAVGSREITFNNPLFNQSMQTRLSGIRLSEECRSEAGDSPEKQKPGEARRQINLNSYGKKGNGRMARVE